MANSLTPEEKSEMMQYLQQEGSDFSPAYMNPDKADWDKIKVPVIDERIPDNPKTCSLDLKSTLDIYGVDVRLVAEQTQASVKSVTDAEGRINTSAENIAQAESRVNGHADAVSKAETRLTGPGGAEERISGMESSASASASSASQDAATVGSIKDEAVAAQEAVARDKQDVAVMKSAVERIYQDASEGGIYGVDFNMATGAAVRIDAAAGLEYHRFIGGYGSTPIPSGKSFMQIGPWAQMYQTLRTVDGNTLVARTGDRNFEETLRSGTCNLFTCIPRYWIKMETPDIDGQPHWIIHVSAKPFAGAFSVIDGDSVEIASIVTGVRGGKHVSMPEVEPKIYTTLNTFESESAKQGLFNNSWKDFLAWWILMLVQTASLNSQNAVGSGVSSGFPYSSDPSYKCQEATTNGHTLVVQDKGYKVGMTVYVATAYYENNIRVGTITNIATHSNGSWKVLTLDGDPFSTTTESWCTCHGQRVTADAVLEMGLNCGYHKTYPDFSEGQCHAFVYGICDPWGNVFQCTSGIAKFADKLYLASGRELSPASLPMAGWNEADDFVWPGEGYPKKWRIGQVVNSISLVPTELGGNTGFLFGDYMWGAADAIRVPWRGGHWAHGGHDGALCLDWYTASDSTISYGGRLAYQKK